MTVMTLLRAFDHKKGEAYLVRSGLDGGVCCPGFGDEIPAGWGKGVSKSRYKYSMSGWINLEWDCSYSGSAPAGGSPKVESVSLAGFIVGWAAPIIY